MKKVFFTYLLIFSSFLIFSQQINKELVVVEIKTGTWCQYCPGAAMGADDLVENFGDAVAVIENHGGDSYQNDASTSRINYYGSSGYPTAYFNGGNSIVGGDHDNTMYPNYLPVYNSAVAVMTSFDVSTEVTPVSDYTYSVTVIIDKVHDYSGTNLVTHLALTESHIEESWQGMDELNFVNRKMFPTASGTVLDFSSVNQEIINYTVTLDNEWVVEKCELVAFVQDNSSKEILQGTKTSLNIPIGINNIMLKEINYPTGDIEICEDAISPIITVKNRGSEDIISFNVNYEINSESVQTYTWTGNLPFGETTEVVLDEIIYSPVSTNTLEISLVSPNGTDDDDLSNNTMDINFDKSLETTSRIYLEINPAGSFGLPWYLIDSEDVTVYSGNASGTNIINEVFNLSLNECYTFTFTSMMGNGIPGDGYFVLTDSEDNEIYYGAGNSFTDEVIIPFKVTTLSDINENETSNISVYPNPAFDQIYINSDEVSLKNVSIIDLSGKIIYSVIPDKKNTMIMIDTGSFSSGIYFVKTITDKGIIIKKISVIK